MARKKAAKKAKKSKTPAKKKTTPKGRPAKKVVAKKQKTTATGAPSRKAKKASKAKARTAKKPTGTGKTKKVTAKKSVAKKAVAKKAPAKKAAPKKAAVKEPVAKKVPARKRAKTKLGKPALAAYKDKLLARKAELARQVLVQNDDMDELRDDQPADPLDMAMNTSSLELMTALGNNERMELSEIDEALIKIEANTYGLCEVCIDEPLKLCSSCPSIPKARLDALPTARYCVQVKEQQERTPGAYTDRPRRRVALLGDEMGVLSDDE